MFKNLLTIMAMFFILSSSVLSEKRVPVNSSEMDNCFLDGGEMREDDIYFACCYAPTSCIVCRKGAGGECLDVSPSSPLLRDLKRAVTPPSTSGNFIAPAPKRPSLRDQLKSKRLAPALPTKAVGIQ